VSESEEPQKSPVPRKRSSDDDICDNNKKRSLLWKEENNLIFKWVEPQKRLSPDNESNDNNFTNTVLSIKEKNYFALTKNEIKENIEGSLFSNEAKHTIVNIEDTQNSPGMDT